MRWGRTRDLVELMNLVSRAFLREGRLPAPLRMHSLDLERQGSSLRGQVWLMGAVRALAQQTEQLLHSLLISPRSEVSLCGHCCSRVAMWIP